MNVDWQWHEGMWRATVSGKRGRLMLALFGRPTRVVDGRERTGFIRGEVVRGSKRLHFVSIEVEPRPLAVRCVKAQLARWVADYCGA